MRAFKNQLHFLLPNCLFLISSINEDTTEGNIETMGRNLAIEVKKYIESWCCSKEGQTSKLTKITFVGHSLGGIIVRSALPHLELYKDEMHGYISLGSPHLGYMYNTNSLFDAGMWVMQRWKKS